jgi:hypothetical protein
MVRIRLTRKLAALLNGVDVSALKVGDVIELPDAAAHMLVAERWAEPVFDAAINHIVLHKSTFSNSPSK